MLGDGGSRYGRVQKKFNLVAKFFVGTFIFRQYLVYTWNTFNLEQVGMQESARDIIKHYKPDFPLKHCGRIYRKTTEFMDINYGDVICLGNSHYLVLRNESECRFGLEDPKYWVKRCQELETKERKILKLKFHENFIMNIGKLKIHCFRSPEKEARILSLVRNDFRFMQGQPILDNAGNVVRVLDIVRGKQIDTMVENIEAGHFTYFHEHFPNILERFISACEGIKYLHAHGEKHGDIRRDHLFVDTFTGCYRWIDFDYTFEFNENPFGLDIFGLGNILLFLVGKMEHNSAYLREVGFSEEIISTITPGDYSLMFPNRIVNLKKIYPYIPTELNRILCHFSAASEVFYESVEELLMDLVPCKNII